tara:strand:+ start:903 stop:1178 length:276 start_codon:yes stop_codon:yes gene_type:complete
MKYALPLVLTILVSGCVMPDTVLEYAVLESPNCTDHTVESHNYGAAAANKNTPNRSTTNITMICDGQKTMTSYKCEFGWGIISDTTCHKNN